MVGAVSALLDNDVAAMVALMPQRKSPGPCRWPEKRDEMAQQLAMGLPMIATEDGVNQIKQMVRAQVEGSAEQIKGGIGMASGMLGGMLAKAAAETPEAEKAAEQAQQVAAAIGDWLQSAGIDNPDNAVQAVDILISTFKKTGIETSDQFKALSFDDAMVHAGTMVGGLKQALNVYQLDLDGILKSIKVETKSHEGDKATLAIAATVFGVAVDNTVEVSKQDGQWMPVNKCILIV